MEIQAWVEALTWFSKLKLKLDPNSIFDAETEPFLFLYIGHKKKIMC